MPFIELKEEEKPATTPIIREDAAEIAIGGSPFVERKTDVSDIDVGLDSKKTADVLPISKMAGIPPEQLYESHKEVKEVVQRKKDISIIENLSASYRQADYHARQSWLGWVWLNGNADESFEREIAKLDGQIAHESQFIDDEGLFDKTVSTVAGLLPIRFESLREGIKGGLATSMLVGGATLLTAPPLAPAATLTSGIIGTTAFSIGHMTKLEAGGLAIKLRRLRDDKGNPIDPQIIRAFSLAYGAVAGALEIAEVNILLKTIPGLDKIMKDVVEKSVTKLLRDGSVGSFLLGAAGRYGKFLGKEVGIEVAQEGASIVLEEVAKDTHELVTDGVIDDATFEEIITQLKDTAFSSLLGFGALGAPGHVMQTLPGLIDTRSQVKERRLQDILPPDKEINFDTETKNTFQRIKNVFFTQRDTRLYKNKNEGRVLHEELAGLIKEDQTAEELAVAIQLYIDSKNNPEAVEAALRGERYEAPVEEKRPVSKDFAGVPYKPKVEVSVPQKLKLKKHSPGVYSGKVGNIDVQIYRAESGKYWSSTVTVGEYGSSIYQEESIQGRSKQELRQDIDKFIKTVQEKQLTEAETKKKEPKKLTKPLDATKTRLVEMSQKLTQKQKEFADKIQEMYKAIADEAMGDEVIFNTLNNFVSRSWIRTKKTQDMISRLTQTTVHAKERRLPTIVEGWTEGLEMKTHSVTDNLVLYRDTLIKTIEQKRFINTMLTGKTEGGNPIFTTEATPGYDKINMPNYHISKGMTYFAPESIAKNINNIFGVSKLYDVKGVEGLTKLNAMLKKIALSTSFFHNIAFLRSYYLGGKTLHWENMNFFTAHREGVEMIHNMDKVVELAVGNGMTLNLIQDWEEDLLVMGNDLERIVRKETNSKRIRSLVSDLWRRQVEFTFGVQGAGLKVKAFQYEFMNEMKRNPDANINEVAARVAKLMNDDFGGLHLERIGRNPTLQHVFRLFTLAPDWTESNIRTVVGMFRKKNTYTAQRQLYRRFWARIVLKTTMATAMMNVLMAGGDPEEAYKRWRKGVNKDWKNVASVDITPLWGLFGQKVQDRRYFSVAGHFLDPIKYSDVLLGEPKILQYKASIIARLVTDWLFNENWRGKRFKNLGEIPTGVTEFTDYLDPDTYVTYRPETKRGKFLTQHLSFPAFFIHSVIGSSPIAFQNLMAAISGEQDVMSSIFNTLGIRQPRTKKKRRR